MFSLKDAEPRSTDRVGRRARLVAGATPAAREYSEYDDDGCNDRQCATDPECPPREWHDIPLSLTSSCLFF